MAAAVVTTFFLLLLITASAAAAAAAVTDVTDDDAIIIPTASVDAVADVSKPPPPARGELVNRSNRNKYSEWRRRNHAAAVGTNEEDEGFSRDFKKAYCELQRLAKTINWHNATLPESAAYDAHHSMVRFYGIARSNRNPGAVYPLFDCDHPNNIFKPRPPFNLTQLLEEYKAACDKQNLPCIGYD